VEAPGAAPGSEWFIAAAIYFHSRQAGTLNIGRFPAKWRPVCVKKTHQKSGPVVEKTDRNPPPTGIGPFALVTAVAAMLASTTRLNPFWVLLGSGCVGFAGFIG
jgi:hypothetical protein